MNSMTDLQKRINKEIIQPPYTTVLHGRIVFPTNTDTGWSFTTPEPITVPVVVTSAMHQAFVGKVGDDGIMWRGGVAFVPVGGDEELARRNSISYLTDCQI